MTARSSDDETETPSDEERGSFVVMIALVIALGIVLAVLPWFSYSILLLPVGIVLIVFPSVVLLARLGFALEVS